jgi:hypothetical protein
LGLAAVLLALLALGPSGGPAAAQKKEVAGKAVGPVSLAGVATFIGKLDGAPDSARIGLVVKSKKQLVCYVCSNDAKFNKANSTWLRAEVDDKGQFKTLRDGISLSGTVRANDISGRLGSKGKSFKFHAEKLKPGEKGGVFRGRKNEKDGKTEVVAGWIVDRDGHICGNIFKKLLGEARKVVSAFLPKAAKFIIEKGLPFIESVIPGFPTAVVAPAVSAIFDLVFAGNDENTLKFKGGKASAPAGSN